MEEAKSSEAVVSCSKLTSRRVKINVFLLLNRDLGLWLFVKTSINFKNNQSSKRNSVANSNRSITAQNHVHLYTQLLEKCKNTWNKVHYTGGSLHCGLNRPALNFQECLFYTQCPTKVCRVFFNKLKIQHVCRQQYWKADILNSSAIISDCHHLGIC